jgi:hypothetical protein
MADANADGLDGDAAQSPDQSAESGQPDGSRADAATDAKDAAVADASMPCSNDAGTGPGEDIWAPDVGTVTEAGAGTDAGSLRAHALYCTADTPCPRPLICVGGGCDDIWECFSHFEPHHPCPTDLAPYCGCDGVTFYAIRSCPDRPYDRAGRCEDGVNCDPTQLRCSGPEIDCPEGQVPSVVDGHYGPCVPFGLCQCEFVWECPHREKYACDSNLKRCQALPRDP